MPDPNYGYDARYDMPGRLGQYIRGARAVKDFVQEHPAQAAAGAVALPFLPATWPGYLAAGGIMAGTRAIDMTHPLTDEQSDFETRTGLDNFVDIAGNGVAAVPMQYGAGLVGRALAGGARPASTLASGFVGPAERAAMVSGYRAPAMREAIPDLTAIERNQSVINRLASVPRDPPAPPLREVKDAFRDYVPMIDKNVSMYFPGLPKGPGFKMPIGSWRVPTARPDASAKALDPAFLRLIPAAGAGLAAGLGYQRQ